MRKFITVLLLSVLSVPASFAITLDNPGFETGSFADWATFGGDWRTGTGADANTGTYGGVNDVLASGGGNFRGIFQNHPATAGNLYSGGCYIRTVDIESSESYFEIQFHDSSGTILSTHQSDHVTTDQAYTYVGLNYIEAPANAVTISVRGIVFVPSSPPDTDFHVFDDFEIDEVVPPDPLLTNPGFETGDFTGWLTFGSGWRTSAGDANNGSYGVVDDVLTTDGDAFRGIFQNVAVTAGASYSVGVQIKAVNVEDSESWLEVQWFNAAGGVISQVQSAHVTSDQAFNLYELNELTAPAGAVTVGVRGIVQMVSAPTVDTDFHAFDDFFLLQPVDLDIDIFATTNYLQTGAEVTYAITIRNGSVAPSGTYYITNDLTANLNYVSSTDGGVNNGQYVSWQLNGLGGGAATTVYVTANQPVFTGDTQEFANVVGFTVLSAVGDPDTSNNSTTTTATTVGIPMLSTIAFLLLGVVIVYVFYQRHRERAGVTA